MDAFDQELRALIANAKRDELPHEELEAAVAELHRRHGRTVPPPIEGTIAVTEPHDGFGTL